MMIIIAFFWISGFREGQRKRVQFSDTYLNFAGASYFKLLNLVSKTRWAGLPCSFARPANWSMGGYQKTKLHYRHNNKYFQLFLAGRPREAPMPRSAYADGS